MTRRGPRAKAKSIKILDGSKREAAKLKRSRKGSANPTPKPRPPRRLNKTRKPKPPGAAAGDDGEALAPPKSVKADSIARRYFDWLAARLIAAGIGEAIDRTVVEHMALDYAEERRAAEHVATDGAVLTSINTGNAYVNPWWSIMVAARKRIDSRLDSLGMTPRARQTMEFDTSPADDAPDLLAFSTNRGAS
jgi:P27 family predicted phage terminase small subunit